MIMDTSLSKMIPPSATTSKNINNSIIALWDPDSGFCLWPNCETQCAQPADYNHFFKHLFTQHRPSLVTDSQIKLKQLMIKQLQAKLQQEESILSAMTDHINFLQQIQFQPLPSHLQLNPQHSVDNLIRLLATTAGGQDVAKEMKQAEEDDKERLQIRLHNLTSSLLSASASVQLPIQSPTVQTTTPATSKTTSVPASPPTSLIISDSGHQRQNESILPTTTSGRREQQQSLLDSASTMNTLRRIEPKTSSTQHLLQINTENLNQQPYSHNIFSEGLMMGGSSSVFMSPPSSLNTSRRSSVPFLTTTAETAEADGAEDGPFQPQQQQQPPRPPLINNILPFGSSTPLRKNSCPTAKSGPLIGFPGPLDSHHQQAAAWLLRRSSFDDAVFRHQLQQQEHLRSLKYESIIREEENDVDEFRPKDETQQQHGCNPEMMGNYHYEEKEQEGWVEVDVQSIKNESKTSSAAEPKTTSASPPQTTDGSDVNYPVDTDVDNEPNGPTTMKTKRSLSIAAPSSAAIHDDSDSEDWEVLHKRDCVSADGTLQISLSPPIQQQNHRSFSNVDNIHNSSSSSSASHPSVVDVSSTKPEIMETVEDAGGHSADKYYSTKAKAERDTDDLRTMIPSSVAPPLKADDSILSGLNNIEGKSYATKIDDGCATPTKSIDEDLSKNRELYRVKSIRPQHSYAELIKQAIIDSTCSRRTLQEIYAWFVETFAYFREHQSSQWKNAIRHNLSLQRCFKRTGDVKGSFWVIDYEDRVAGMKKRKRRQKGESTQLCSEKKRQLNLLTFDSEVSCSVAKTPQYPYPKTAAETKLQTNTNSFSSSFPNEPTSHHHLTLLNFLNSQQQQRQHQGNILPITTFQNNNTQMMMTNTANGQQIIRPTVLAVSSAAVSTQQHSTPNIQHPTTPNNTQQHPTPNNNNVQQPHQLPTTASTPFLIHHSKSRGVNQG